MADNSLSATVTHEQAREAYKKLHDHVYCGGRIPTLSVPPQPTDVDIVLCNYIEQQAALSVESGEGTPQPESKLVQSAIALVEAMETCHVCKGFVILDEGPIRCEDCSSDCEEHDDPECVPIYKLHESLKKALAARESTAPREDTATLTDWKQRALAAEQAIMVDDMKLATALHINYCEDLIEDGTPWEVAAEPEPSYFESLHEAVVYLVNLPELAGAPAEKTE